MQKQYLVTDFYHYEKYNDNLRKKYLEIPVFDKTNKLKNNIFLKDGKIIEKKLGNITEMLKYINFI